MPPENREEKVAIIVSNCKLTKDARETVEDKNGNNEKNEKNEKRNETTSKGRDSADAWFTLVIVFLVNVLLGLNWVAFSVFYIYFTDCFDSTKSTTGWIGSIQVGVTQMFGILVSPMVSKCGCRTTAFLGSWIVFVAMLLSFYAIEVWHLHLTYGLLAGIGLCMLYISNAVVLQQKFKYNRAFAAGIGMSGLSLGSTMGSPVTEWLIELYGWRGALMMHAAIIAHCMILTLLFKTPLQPRTRKHSKHLTASKEVLAAEKTRSFLSHLCEFSLLREKSFTLFCLAYVCLMINSSAFWYHLQSRAVFKGIPINQAAFLTSFLAFAIFITRIIFSIIANLQCSNTILLFTVGCCVGASASFLLTCTSYYAWMALCAVIFGSHIGCSVTVITVSAVYLVGVDRIARGQAFLNFSYGIAALVSTPFAGWIVDVSGNYDVPFWINGCVALCACVLAFCSYILSRHKLYKEIVL